MSKQKLVFHFKLKEPLLSFEKSGIVPPLSLENEVVNIPGSYGGPQMVFNKVRLDAAWLQPNLTFAYK